MILEKLIPANSNNSVAEATLTLFLVQEIENPESFRELINNSFKDKYQQFVDIKDTSTTIVKGLKKQEMFPSFITRDGFLFVNFEDGVRKRALRGLNKNLSDNKNILSYHEFVYTRWENFLNSFKENIKIVSEHSNKLLGQAFNLSFLDSFTWEGEQFPPIDLIFNKDEGILPNEVFVSNKPWKLRLDFTEECEDHGVNYNFEQLINVKVVKSKIKNLFTITLLHQIICQLNKSDFINVLINDESFTKNLEEAHKHNKKLLVRIFKKEILEKINLV